ncbi:unnamed protein product [Bursaphelenchus xylophilus]|uniref:(pine wood nematode) hypothetical protein n=1 Tax=Bursaphelenchus xylophilus TaxID=6326 RepID=A0A1I7RWC2_BURXY|nr:unnamed protein product [Bursaphelenchus xylophilus]CAG9095443.1 unnamed protein product [Bursaphelenchus xylophilus]
MLLSRRIPRQYFRSTRTFFSPRQEYWAGDGVKSKEDVYKEKPEEDPADFTITGKRRRTDHFHYSDRKSGKGYTDFSDSPFLHRQYVYPPIRRDVRRAPYIMLVLASFLFFDYRWLLYHVNQQIERFFPGYLDWFNDTFVQIGDTDDFQERNE